MKNYNEQSIIFKKYPKTHERKRVGYIEIGNHLFIFVRQENNYFLEYDCKYILENLTLNTYGFKTLKGAEEFFKQNYENIFIPMMESADKIMFALGEVTKIIESGNYDVDF